MSDENLMKNMIEQAVESRMVGGIEGFHTT
jgi:hypothetical protein